MSFLLPLGFLFGLSLPALMIFYLLKVKRKPRRISSTWLWREAIADSQASVPFQKLRRNVLMLLQLLTLALLTAALARPVINLVSAEETSALILIDVSASMGMRPSGSGPTRLAEAKDKAARFVQSLPRGSQALLVSYADRAAVVVPFTTDRAAIVSAINGLKLEAAEDELAGALGLAASLRGPARNPRIVIFSDSAQLDAKQIASLESTPVTLETCGATASNIGWTRMDLRQRSPSSGIYDFFGKLARYGEGPEEVTLKIESEGAVLDARKLQLSPGGETSFVVEGLALKGEPILHGSFEIGEKGFDALEMDDHAWAQVRTSRKLRVLLYSQGNYFLSRALGSAEGIEVVNAAPGQIPPAGLYDAAIYDRATPEHRPAAPALYIGVSPWNAPASDVEGEESAPGEITEWDTEHPVTANVQWTTVTIFGAHAIKPPQGTRTLLQSKDFPLLLLGRAGDQVALFLTFDLFRSNLPLRAGFPIFVMNAINWLTEGRASREILSLHGGEAYRLSVPETVNHTTIRSPKGEVFEIHPGPDRSASFAQTYEVGLWSVEFDGKVAERFGVNLMDRRETEGRVGESSTFAGSGELQARGLGTELRTNQEIWKWFALAALGLLAVEWVLYQRQSRF